MGLGSVMGAGVLTQQYRLPSRPRSLTSFLSHLPERLPALEFFTESVPGGAQTQPSFSLPLWGFHKQLLVKHRPVPACAWATEAKATEITSPVGQMHQSLHRLWASAPAVSSARSSLPFLFTWLTPRRPSGFSSEVTSSWKPSLTAPCILPAGGSLLRVPKGFLPRPWRLHPGL